MKSIALYNSKGGVGKTTSVVNLAYLAAVDDMRVLVWDLDPQASATFFYRIPPKLKGGVKKVVTGKQNIEKYSRATQYGNIRVIPADFSTRKLDIIFNGMKKPKKQVRKLVEEVGERCDIMFLDCPPGFSLLSENILHGVDFILMPMIPTPLSVRTYLQMVEYFEDKGFDQKRIITFFSLVDRRKNIHREIVEAYGAQENFFLKSFIPYSSDVEKMGKRCAPLNDFSPASRASEAYRRLWQEIKTRIY